MAAAWESAVRLGAMQDWPLRVTRSVDHAEREHGDGEIVTAWATEDTRTNWRNVAAMLGSWRRRLNGLA